MKHPKRPRSVRNKVEERMVNMVDELNEFREFRQTIMPRIRKLIKEGKKAEDLYKEHRDMLAARKLSIALDPSVAPEKALTAITDIENRLEGKPREARDITHKFAQMPDKQIDALLLSELEVEALEPAVTEEEKKEGEEDES